MSETAKKYYTPEEYLAFEEQSEDKHEYYRGEIYLMSGGSTDHSGISVNICNALDDALLDQPCRVFNSDLRIYVEANGLYTYPDASVVCLPINYANSRTDIVTNPVLIAEVLSPSTARYDQIEKFELYQSLATLQDYLLISQDRVFVRHYQRLSQDSWLLRPYRNLETTLEISNLGISIPLTRIYRKVEFTENVNLHDGSS